MAVRMSANNLPEAQEASPENPAETYERYMVPALFTPAAEILLDAARPAAGERVLDVGCGTGIVARRVAARNDFQGSLAGLDPNPNMLAVARVMAAQDGLSVTWYEGRAESMPFPAGSFDLILSQFALMYFSDRPRALSEVRRVLAPGGRLALSVWQGIERHPFYRTLDRAIERHLGTSAVGEIFSLGDAGALSGLLNEAGFTDVHVSPFSFIARFPQPDTFVAGEIDVLTAAIPAMQRLDVHARRALASAIADEMAAALQSVTVNDQVHLPFHRQIATAT